MFAHIVVPVDFTRANDRALSLAARLARASGARVTLLHVIEAIDGVPARELSDFYGKLRRSAVFKAQRAAARLARQEIAVTAVVLVGRRAEAIARYGARSKDTLIVLRSHQVDPRRPGRGWATISYQVAVHARCSVLLIK
jgi:nucleotide-binding universal stress UspA family protein